ncbi:MAG: bifunctional UDP-4-keto-pentose/UDP-xylose synthase [Acidimicrobiia bacterium]
MKLLIVGAGGFIGSNLIGTLIERGEHEIVGLDITNQKLEGIEGPNFKFIEADISASPELADKLVSECDVVVDLIAYANPSIYVESPLDVVRLNFFENIKIAELCMRHGKRLFQYSTSEVYGKSGRDGAYNEDTSDLIMGPTSKQRWIYASGKQYLERIIHAHGLRGDIEYTIVRPFNFVGPRFDYLVEADTLGGPRVFAHFMSALLTGGSMYLVDGGNQRRSFTHIDDASDAFTVLLDSPDSINQIYNIGNPDTDTSIKELARYMMSVYEEITGEKPTNELVEISGEDFYGKGYEDMDRVPPDITKLKALGWTPTRDMHTTFSDAIVYNLNPKIHASIL